MPASASGRTCSYTEQMPLLVAEPLDACRPLEAHNYAGSAVLVSRGACSFADKAAALQAANASLAIVYNDAPGCMVMATNGSGPANSSLVAVSVSSATGALLLTEAARGASVSAWAPQYSRLDAGALVLWAIAVATVVGAALWAGHDYSREALSAGAGADTEGEEKAAVGSVEVQEISVVGAVVFVVFASTMLLLLFFFLNHVFAVVLAVLFSLASMQALVALFAAALARGVPTLQGLALQLPLATGSGWAWPLQDLMGVALMLLILRQFRLPSIKVASVLLPLCFLYDIFWVFLQPLLIGGPSVMVATGGASHEMLPVLLLVPRLQGPPSAYSMLGYGDVVLPGLLLVYLRIFDVQHRRRGLRGYLPPAAVGYATGLLLTYGALYLSLGGDQGQPALLYLVPCTLGLSLVLARLRGDLGAMWAGSAPDPKAADPLDLAASPGAPERGTLLA
ncbi:hypothetical protein WJX81_006352 [Elliptochloris bilobata]|uniref:PA domain-containing protein n=1 Tax=Elliptochloris bilobata TaxID=381761 RepID=A0AAW1QBR0_9CHLO